ncbi:MAG: bacterial Ig-like domain-containing protein [Clostridia bacterium]|nr:bacterial Ig-like domain-containing protein [Clostridia bacterium]
MKKHHNYGTRAAAVLPALLLIVLQMILSAFPAGADDVTPEVPIVTAVITGIEVSSPPNKTRYFVGDDLVISGAKLRIDYSDGGSDTVDIKNEWCSGFDSYTAGSKTVSVKYPDWDDPASFTVEVVYPSVSYIKIKTNPRKLTYYTGQVLDPAGISVMATYENGYTEDVSSEVTYSPTEFTSAADSRKITVTYKTDKKVFTATFSVKVVEKAPKSLSLVHAPDKKDYLDGEAFDPSGVAVDVVYNDGTVEHASADELVFSGFDPGVLGTCRVTVSCRGVSAEFEVNVTLSPDHQHTPGEPVISPAPTCTEPGLEIISCLVCGETVESREIPAQGHSWGEFTVDSEPAYMKAGSKTHVCSVCGVSETVEIPPLSRSVSDEAGSVVMTLEGEGTDCFPSGSFLVSTDIRELLTQSEAEEAQALAASAGGSLADISEITLSVPDGGSVPGGNLLVSLSVPEGKYAGYAVFFDGKQMIADYSASDRTIRFLLQEEARKTSSVCLIVAIPYPPETEPETTPAATQTPGEDTFSPEPQGSETAVAPFEGSDPADTGERSQTDPEDGGKKEPGITRTEMVEIFRGVGIVIGCLLILAIIIAFLYKRFLY